MKGDMGIRKRCAVLVLLLAASYAAVAQTGVLPEPPPILPPSAKQSPDVSILTAPPPPEPRFSGTRSDVIRVIVGLIGLFGLAYLGGRPFVRALERRLGIAHLITAGLPFVLLGVIASHPSVGILSPLVLYELRPLLVLGLGWIGFTIGFRFDADLMKSLWPGIGAVVTLTAAWPFATALLLCGGMLWFAEGKSGAGIFLRDGIILGTAGAMTGSTTADLLRVRGVAEESIKRIRTVIQLEDLAAVVGLMLVAAYFRSPIFQAAWTLPGTAWLFITIGMGATMGAVIYPILGKIEPGPEFVVVMLGSVSFTAGMASYLRLSPVVVCFIAGAILVNLPGGAKDQVRETLEHLERPIYLLFLIVAGSLWQIGDWRGWALMGLFVIARVLGKWIGVVLLRYRDVGGLDPQERRNLVLAPLGALSIAIVVSAEDLYFSPSIPWMVTAVIGGAIVTEVLVQWFSGRRRRQ
jgi:Kef-type K+ transport system membrane component KefB